MSRPRGSIGGAIGAHNMRHILGLSGGKDSTALALYLKDKVPNIEYFFCDTHAELPETYSYLSELESKLGKKITFLSSGGFDYCLEKHNGFLPSPKARWCTKDLKIKPFEAYVGSDNAISYIGLRADENRVGYISTKSNIKPVFPFMNDGLNKNDILNILDNNGLGLPAYYKWRSRSGCFFCFFQRKIEWVRLSEIHPGLFEKAMRYETSHKDGRTYTWNRKESLSDLRLRKDKIISRYNRLKKSKPYKQLDIFESIENRDDNFCYVCNI